MTLQSAFWRVVVSNVGRKTRGSSASKVMQKGLMRFDNNESCVFAKEREKRTLYVKYKGSKREEVVVVEVIQKQKKEDFGGGC